MRVAMPAALCNLIFLWDHIRSLRITEHIVTDDFVIPTNRNEFNLAEKSIPVALHQVQLSRDGGVLSILICLPQPHRYAIAIFEELSDPPAELSFGRAHLLATLSLYTITMYSNRCTGSCSTCPQGLHCITKAQCSHAANNIISHRL